MMNFSFDFRDSFFRVGQFEFAFRSKTTKNNILSPPPIVVDNNVEEGLKSESKAENYICAKTQRAR